ncbi:MAG: flagellar biosynthetic protein FliR, partial [Terriglobia bacterium]
MPVQFEPILIKALLVGARVSMLMVFAPFLGSGAIPKKAKAGLTIALTALLYPAYAAAPKGMAAGDWLMLVPGELVIGLLIGLSVQIVFDGVQLAGEIVGFQLGFSLESVIDPTTLANTPVLSLFHQSIALLIFLQLDAHFWVLRALAHSFVILPPGSVGVTPAAAKTLLDAAGGIFWIGVQMAAPVLIV